MYWFLTNENAFFIADPCHDNPCSNGGTCSIGEDNKEKCDCAPGFNGDHCENGKYSNSTQCLLFLQWLLYVWNSRSFHIIIIFQIIKELVCNPPCMNGGKCAEDHNENLVCFCKPGYSGIQCEHSKSCIHISS